MAVVAVRGDFTHYTWWSISLYALFLASYLANLHPWTWLMVLCVQLLVIVGVWAMSLSQCGLLRDAAAEAGPLVYVAGNFLMHYWPTIGITLRSTRPRAYKNQATFATLSFLAYCAVKRPSQVYGCDVPYNVVVLMGFIFTTSLSYVISSHTYVARHWGTV